MKFFVKRSNEYVAQLRLELGKNVSDVVEVDVDPAGLTVEARAVLLEAGGGSYCDRPKGGFPFDSDYTFGGYGYGTIYPQMDVFDPGPGNGLSEAIVKMKESLEQRRQEWLAEKQKRDEQKAIDDAAKKAKADALAAARELLKDELSSKDDKISELTASNNMLAKFIAAVPDDAKRGTVRAMIEDAADEEMEDTIKQLENCTRVLLFGNE